MIGPERRRPGARTAIAFTCALVALLLAAPAAHGFGFLPGTEGLAFEVRADGGAPATAIGSHPYQLGVSIGLEPGTELEGQPGVIFPDGDLRDLAVELPPGLLLNPAAIGKCSLALFHTPRSSPFEESRSGESCPDASQVGTVEVKSSLGGGETRRFGLFNLDPAPGTMAQLGAAPYGSPVVLEVGVPQSADGSYALLLSAHNFPQAIDVSGLGLALWGIPWAASHDGERGDCLNEAEPSFPWAKCSVGEPANDVPLAYLTLPTRCQGSLALRATASAWQQPAPVSAQAANLDEEGIPAELGDCTALPFNPKPIAQLTDTKASSASGFAFDMTNDLAGLTARAARAPSQARRLVVELPEGVSVNPSVGAGLGACAPGQYAAETAAGPEGSACPNSAKIGSFELGTPLFEEGVQGAVYLAQPEDPATGAPGAENPFDALIAVYLVARAPERGVLVKAAGRIDPDLGTGRLIATFENLPQLPYTDLSITLRAGQRALLVTPAACGSFQTQTTISPWAGTQGVATISVSQVKSGIGGGPCPSGTPPFAPGVVAGGVNSNVNSYTPYFVHLTRRDTEQEITSYSLVLPRGITGKLAGVPFCPEAAIAAARERRGFAEAASPSCPAASRVGRTLSGYGIGAALAYAPGQIYLAGPYHGAPLSLVTVNAAVLGPFDLGTVVVRSAFQVDPLTAQLRIDSRASDPIPHILSGIPLHLRDVRVYMDRHEFTHNPSSCEPSELVSTLTGSGARLGDPADDSTASVAAPFQLLNCLTLGFKPKLGLRLRGGSRRGDYPELRATFAARGQGDSNLRRIAVTVPRQLFLAQNHIRTVCTRERFAAERCPPGSVYGKAVAYTPLLDEPLRGNVYLRSSPHPLPDLVASLYSGAVRIDLVGMIGPGKGGGIRAFFDHLPDAPLARFVMTLPGGRRGLLVNSIDVCRAPPLASVKALAQNNLGSVFTTRLRGQCGGKGKGHDKRHRQGHERGRGGR